MMMGWTNMYCYPDIYDDDDANGEDYWKKTEILL